MANISVTYNFSNGSTADADQVDQNFSDIISGTSDGSKDLSINNLTCAGTCNFNGAINLGNGSIDDITVTGSLASSFPVKTNNSYDFGSATLGLASVYLGAAGGFTTRLKAAATASHTFTFPATAGTTGYVLENSDGAGTSTWALNKRDPSSALNYSIACSVGASALTITLNGLDGTALSATNAFTCLFRSATAATGTTTAVSLTTSPTLVISSGSTLGHKDATNHYIYVYALNNAGTIELAATSTYFDTGSINSSTAEGGAGAADSIYGIYSTTTRSNVAFKLLARLKSNQTTAGTWAAVPTEISLPPFQIEPISFKSYRASSTQTINNNSATTVIFNTIAWDTHNSANTTSGVWTVPKAAKYRFSSVVMYGSDAWPSGTRMYMNILNGATAYTVDDKSLGAWTGVMGIRGTVILNCAAGDLIKVNVYHNQGGSEAVQTGEGTSWFEAEEIT
jgi:hypothetical protein